MGIYIKGIDVKEINLGAFAAINIDNTAYFASSPSIVPIPDSGDFNFEDVEAELARANAIGYADGWRDALHMASGLLEEIAQKHENTTEIKFGLGTDEDEIHMPVIPADRGC